MLKKGQHVWFIESEMDIPKVREGVVLSYNKNTRIAKIRQDDTGIRDIQYALMFFDFVDARGSCVRQIIKKIAGLLKYADFLVTGET